MERDPKGSGAAMRVVDARNQAICRIVKPLSGTKGCALAAGQPASLDICKRLRPQRDRWDRLRYGASDVRRTTPPPSQPCVAAGAAGIVGHARQAPGRTG